MLGEVCAKALHKHVIVGDHDQLERVLLLPRLDDVFESVCEAFNVLLVKVRRGFVECEDTTISAECFG